ncbi:hypothetical protein MD484_g2181, partial [Candolleomyces efflorescens]
MAPTHINDFPPEILAHTFSFSDCQKDNCKRLLQLASVCRHWHDVLFAYPGFWTTLECSISTKLKNEPHLIVPQFIAHLERWFSRAGDLPWTLALSFNVAPRKTPLLNDHLVRIPRWKNLMFALNIEGASNWIWLEGLIASAKESFATNNECPCWPKLETLEIYAPGARYGPDRFALPLRSIAPNLRQLKITINGLTASIFTVFEDFSWANLTVFEFAGALGSETLRFYLHLLTQAQNLESMKVLDQQHDFTPVSPLPFHIRLPVVHHKLQHLSLHESPNALTFLRNVCLPSLHSFDLARFYLPDSITPPPPSTPVTDAVKALVLMSRCKIRTLRLRWTPLLVQDLFNVVTCHPTVEVLELDEPACAWSGPEVFFNALETAENWRDDLPKLTRFTYIRGFRTHSAQVGEEGFDLLRRAPLRWWKSRVEMQKEFQDELQDPDALQSLANMALEDESEDDD